MRRRSEQQQKSKKRVGWKQQMAKTGEEEKVRSTSERANDVHAHCGEERW